MAFEDSNFEATLLAASGADLELRAELRASYLESLQCQYDLLCRARCDGNWRVAAMRLSGLAASFHDGELARLSKEALAGAPGDPRVLRQIARYAQGMAAQS